MPSRHLPEDALADIIENVARIRSYVVGLDRDVFARSGMVRDAVERCLERVCEAAYRLGDDAARLMPHQPWPDIRGMGNRLRHAYDRISLDVVWNTVYERLPGLEEEAARTLERLRNVSFDD